MASAFFTSLLCGIVPHKRKRKSSGNENEKRDNSLPEDNIKLTYYRYSMGDLDKLIDENAARGKLLMDDYSQIPRPQRRQRPPTNKDLVRVTIPSVRSDQIRMVQPNDTDGSPDKQCQKVPETQTPNKLPRNKFLSVSVEALNDSGIVSDVENKSGLNASSISATSLVRISSIQNRSMRLMRDRHKKVAERKRYSVNVECLLNDRTEINESVADRHVTFVSMPDLNEAEDDDENGFDSEGVKRMSSIHKKSWEIRRRRKQLLVKNRKSKSYDSILLESDL